MGEDGNDDHEIPSCTTTATERKEDNYGCQHGNTADDDAVLDVLRKVAMSQSNAVSFSSIASDATTNTSAARADSNDNDANDQRPSFANARGIETAGIDDNFDDDADDDDDTDPIELTLTRGAPLSVVDQPGAYNQRSGGEFVRRTQIRSSTIHQSLSAMSASSTNGTGTPETNEDGASSSNANVAARPPHRSGSGSGSDIMMTIMEDESGTLTFDVSENPFQVRRNAAADTTRAENLVEASPVEENEFQDLEIGEAWQVANPGSEGNAAYWILSSAKGRRWLTGAVVVILVSASIFAASYILVSRNKDAGASNMRPSNAPSSATTTTTTTTIENVVKGLPNHTQQAILASPLSPQGLAYDWLRHDPLLELYSSSRKIQRFALATLYFATNGPQWLVRGHGAEEWLCAPNTTITTTIATATTRNRTENSFHEVTNSSDQSSHECLWFSKVDTHEADAASERIIANRTLVNPCNAQKEYIAVMLNANNLEGMLPVELGLLTTLEHLRLGENKLSGPIPPSIFSTITNLRGLGFRNNYMTGKIPSEIGLATNLARLILFQNQFDGEIPTAIFHLPQLHTVHMETNYFSGTVPSEVGLATGLRVLLFQENLLEGTIPGQQLGFLTGLQRLSLAANEFTGTVPSQLGLISHLELLTLKSNRLTGSLPSELARLELLSELTVGKNAGISGPVPKFLGKISKLLYLDLGGCDFTGEVPSELGNIQNLTSLHLGGNPGITGSLPSEVARLPALDFLNISGTSLAGTLPDTLCGIKELYFDCSDSLCGCECSCS